MGSAAGWELRWTFSTPLYIICAVLLTLFGIFVRYDEEAANDIHVARYYNYMRDVAMMVFIGFGFLMTFLRNYAYSAVGLNMLCAAVVTLEFIFIGGAVQQVIFDGFKHKILLDIPLMIDALFCAASGMIAFGAVLGKATPSQILWLMVWMVPFYALNQHLVFVTFGALDIGGSISIHAFGAYYGLAASMFVSKIGTGMLEHAANRASYVTDLFSVIGTLFLWLYWPSFNGALASQDPTATLPSEPSSELHSEGVMGEQQFLCIVNTLLSLLGATLAVFATSTVLHRKIDIFQVQNATLAGGVAMGAASNMRIAPVGALAVGIVAGFLSTLGFSQLMPFLERRVGLRDTCGVHNLHGLPGLMGGLVAAIASVAAFSANEPLLVHGHYQFGYQILAMVVTVGIGAAAGAIGGYLSVCFDPCRQDLPALMSFEDSIFWHDVDNEADTMRNALRIAASNHTAGSSRHSRHDRSKDGTPKVKMVMDCSVDPARSDAVMAAMNADLSRQNATAVAMARYLTSGPGANKSMASGSGANKSREASAHKALDIASLAKEGSAHAKDTSRGTASTLVRVVSGMLSTHGGDRGTAGTSDAAAAASAAAPAVPTAPAAAGAAHRTGLYDDIRASFRW